MNEEGVQINFRVKPKVAEVFRQFCKENGFKQAQALDHMLQVMEFDNAKIFVPDRKTEIEMFEKNLKDIMSSYLNSVELGKNAEERAKENFKSLLESKDKTISDLQKKVESFKVNKDDAEKSAIDSASSLKKALKEAELAKEQADMAKKLLCEKEKTISSLAMKLKKVEEKEKEYDSLFEKNKKMQEVIKELNHTLERKDSDFKKDIDLAVAKTEAEKEKEIMNRIMNYEKEITRLSTKLQILET